MTFARIGSAIVRAYVNHMLVFSIGAACGAFTAFVVLMPYIVAASR